MARHELRRVLEHVDEAVQFAQDVVGQMAAGLGLAVDIDRHIGVFPAHFFDEVAQVEDRRVKVGAGAELFIVNRQNERAGARLLLRKLRQIAVAGDPHDLETLVFDGLGHRPNAQPGRVLGAEILVDDDDGEAKFHDAFLAPDLMDVAPFQNRFGLRLRTILVALLWGYFRPDVHGDPFTSHW